MANRSQGGDVGRDARSHRRYPQATQDDDIGLTSAATAISIAALLALASLSFGLSTDALTMSADRRVFSMLAVAMATLL
jgi:hypothetical protein